MRLANGYRNILLDAGFNTAIGHHPMRPLELMIS